MHDIDIKNSPKNPMFTLHYLCTRGSLDSIYIHYFLLSVDAIILIRIRHATERARHNNILICYPFIEPLRLGFRFFAVRLSTTNTVSGTQQ